MAHDYEDIHNTDDLDDSELHRLVREQLGQTKGIDASEISISASAGFVGLSGRVGTDEERRIAEHVVTDVLGIQSFTNDLLVDPNVRMMKDPSGLSADGERDDAPTLDVEVPISGDSPFFADSVVEEPDSSTDVETAMENGTPWSPPDGPTPEGLRGTDAGPEEMDGRH